MTRTRLGIGLGTSLRWTAAVVTGLALLAPAGIAAAQQWPTSDPSYEAPNPSLQEGPEPFGTPGQMMISSAFDLDLRFVTQSFAGDSETTTEFTLSPELLFFLAPNFAVGGLLGFDYVSLPDQSLPGGAGLATDRSSTALQLGPVAAYNIPVSPRVSIFPTLGFLYTWASLKQSVPGGKADFSGYDISMLIRAPVFFHPFPHVLLGITPFTEIDLVAKEEGEDTTKTRTFGFTLDLGFWL